jgi:hypothetical protein
MSATPTTITEAQEQFLDGLRQSQQVLIDAARTMSDASAKVGPAATPLASLSPDTPSPAELIAGSFDFAEKLLATQREFVEQLVAVGATAKPEA